MTVFGVLSRILTVLLVVEGGIGTLDTVKQAILLRTPVLVMDGSGRCADALAYAWRFLHSQDPAARKLTLSGLRQRIRKMLLHPTPEMLDKKQQVPSMTRPYMTPPYRTRPFMTHPHMTRPYRKCSRSCRPASGSPSYRTPPSRCNPSL